VIFLRKSKILRRKKGITTNFSGRKKEFHNHVLGIYFLCVCLARGESESDEEEVDVEDDGNVGRNG
jgi:hypothetical protein